LTNEEAFDLGWRAACDWADRDDLLADMGSKAYINTREAFLAEKAAEQWKHSMTKTLWITLWVVGFPLGFMLGRYLAKLALLYA